MRASRASEVAAVVNGALLCSQLRDQVVLIPFWQSIGPEEAHEWFRKNGAAPALLHAPLLAGGLLAARRASQGPRRGRTLATAEVATLGVWVHAVVTLVVHVPTNIRLLIGARSADEVELLVRRWARWHVVRTAALAFGELAAIFVLIEKRTERCRVEKLRRFNGVV